jgi:TRAP-type uncharacterized transport system substrate-binding protein
MFSAIKIAIILTLLATAAGGVLYVKQLQSNLEIARANVAQMEVAVHISETSVATLQQDAVRNAELNIALQQNLQQAEQYGDELRATLNKHNLTHLANKKPGLIQKRMQNATDKLWDDLAAITDPVGVQLIDSRTQNTNSN